MNFIIHKSKDGQFYSTLVADNGETLMTSEMYTQKHSCIETVNVIMDDDLIDADIIDQSGE